MKKIAVIALIALVVVGCVFLAGCTQNPTVKPVDGDDTSIKNITPDLTINVNNIAKSGKGFCPGQIVEINLPGNPTTGYQWMVTQQDDGLDIKSNYLQTDAPEGMVGVGGVYKFWISAEKPGTYNFTLKYMRSWEGEDSAVATYSDSFVVEDKEDTVGVNGASLEITYDKSNLKPVAGSTVLVTMPGNATTGYHWVAEGSDGLKVINHYEVDEHEEGMVGVGGKYMFYATAEKPGKYTLTLTEKFAGSDDALTVIDFPLIFV